MIEYVLYEGKEVAFNLRFLPPLRKDRVFLTESIPFQTVKMTGEFRKPLKGEYYISGAIPEAYQAFNDINDSFHIAKRVEPPARVIWIDGFQYKHYPHYND